MSAVLVNHGAIIVSLIVLAGCSTAHWTKPGATAADFNRDSYECAQQHQENSASWRPYQGFRSGVTVSKDLYRGCMQAKGYNRNDPNGWEGFRD